MSCNNFNNLQFISFALDFFIDFTRYTVSNGPTVEEYERRTLTKERERLLKS